MTPFFEVHGDSRSGFFSMRGVVAYVGLVRSGHVPRLAPGSSALSAELPEPRHPAARPKALHSEWSPGMFPDETPGLILGHAIRIAGAQKYLGDSALLPFFFFFAEGFPTKIDRPKSVP